MTSEAQARTEHVGRGALLALVIIPVGAFVFVLISSIGIFASIISLGIAFAAYWLYQRGAGGVITRTGAYVITSVVAVTVLLGLFASLVWVAAQTVAKSGVINPDHYSVWKILGLPQFWNLFGDGFGDLLKENALVIVLALAFGFLGSFRILRNAFRTTSARPTQAYPPAPSSTVTPQAYRNDVDAPPTGSADDKTAPPASGV